MYISMYMKSGRRTLAQARAELPSLLRAVERGAEIEITRRGVPVAVVLSIAERERLAAGRQGFGEAYDAFVKNGGLAAPVPRGHFAKLRDRSTGRKVRL